MHNRSRPPALLRIVVITADVERQISARILREDIE
jgi:hypothetical protein